LAAKQCHLVRQADVDWVIFLDADEYWIPASGSLRDYPDLAFADVLTVARYNIPLASGGPLIPFPIAVDHYDELLLIADLIPAFRTHLRVNNETPWIRCVPVPKVMARRDRIGGLVDGGFRSKTAALHISWRDGSASNTAGAGSGTSVDPNGRAFLGSLSPNE
jgi:hypothetical protein